MQEDETLAGHSSGIVPYRSAYMRREELSLISFYISTIKKDVFFPSNRCIFFFFKSVCITLNKDDCCFLDDLTCRNNQGYSKSVLQIPLEKYLSSQKEEKYSEDKKIFSQGREKRLLGSCYHTRREGSTFQDHG